MCVLLNIIDSEVILQNMHIGYWPIAPDIDQLTLDGLFGQPIYYIFDLLLQPIHYIVDLLLMQLIYVRLKYIWGYADHTLL